MLAVKVEIVRFLENHPPGIVECQLVDALGRAWFFVVKVPLVTADDLDDHSDYPRPGAIACEEMGRSRDDSGREVVTVDTEGPSGIESAEGVTRFEVLASSLVES